MSQQQAATAGASWRAAVGFFRRPAVIVSEVVAFAAGAALAASLPQQPDADAVKRFADGSPALGRIAAALGLHDITTSAWFLTLAGLCFLSLVAVQAQQWPRLFRAWRTRLEPATFGRAPFRRAVPLEAARAVPPAPRFEVSGRASLLGSPVFHLGLLVLVVAGLVRLLGFSDAVTRAYEGQRYEVAPGAFEQERGGWLARPFALPQPVTVEQVKEERYESGALRQVSVVLRLDAHGGEPGRAATAAINAPLDLGDVRLYVNNAHGLAALLELEGPQGVERLAVPLDERGGEWRGGVRPGGDLELRFRTGPTARPSELEARILAGGALLGIAQLRPGTQVALGPGRALRLQGLPYWVQLRGSRDPSRPLFFAGVVIAIAGVVLLFGFTRVETAVFAEGDQLVVALRPQRLAPLYAERFEALCKEWIA
ncbi:MAG: cytochrome c biogenesis protein ResB [Deltaproteobacteria bacterium]|nr:cytochrome c biogenesis protein ResB [Deltaproteobacteria bacterium]